jgi:hypothetical protein
MSNYVGKTHYALNSLTAVAGRLARMTAKARYVLGECELVQIWTLRYKLCLTAFKSCTKRLTPT